MPLIGCRDRRYSPHMEKAADVMSTFWRVIDRLEQASILYMLTGSLALNCYGQTRATNDIDIVILVAVADADRLYTLFVNDFYVSRDAVREACATAGMFNVIDNASVFKVDFIVAKSSAMASQQFGRRQRIPIGNRDVCVITPEDLILAKLEWSRESGSEMQERDIQNVMRSTGSRLDVAYLKQWAAQCGCLDRLERLYATI